VDQQPNIFSRILQKRAASFRYAFHGIATLLRSQPNARIHLIAAIAALGAAYFLKISTGEWALVVLCIAAVFAAEAFNTALEFLTDLVSPDYHELAGKTKDVAAAGVLLTALGAALVGILIFGPKLYTLFFS
jgi:diacylglycerol kinase